jgi:hypothetical protein
MLSFNQLTWLIARKDFTNVPSLLFTYFVWQ